MTDAEIRKALREPTLVLTGAGVSAASGIQTFRGANGLYEGVDVTRLATPEGFESDPVLVWQWYASRIKTVEKVSPNAAHRAIVRLPNVTLITSNVDDLHERAGSPRVHHLHGKILEARCTVTNRVFPIGPTDLAEPIEATSLPRSPEGHLLRPNVVWFGERPWTEAIEAFERAVPNLKTMLEVGVSGQVTYGLTELVARLGVRVIRLNPDPLPKLRGATDVRARAEDRLPEWV